MDVIDTATQTLDIVIPFYNEQEVLPVLFGQLREAFSPAKMAEMSITRVRFLMIDDGSSDASATVARDAIDAGLPVNLYRFSRNFGHQNAICAGLDKSDADFTAIIDADLQDPPELIARMIARAREGNNVVFGKRNRRIESVLKRCGYWLFYRLVRQLSEFDIPLDSGDFCVLDRKAVDAIRRLPEKLRFVRGLRAWVGLHQSQVPYDRPTRTYGKPKYTFKKLYRLATDGIASCSIRPLQIAQVFSFLFFIGSAALSLLFVLLVSTGRTPVAREVLAGYILICLSCAVQTFCIYIMGAYVGRTYLEVKGRPNYLIMEEITFDGTEPA